MRVAQSTGYLLDFPAPVPFDEAMRLPRSELDDEAVVDPDEHELVIARAGRLCTMDELRALGAVAVGPRYAALRPEQMPPWLRARLWPARRPRSAGR